MEYSHEVQNMCCVAKGPNHGPAPIPEEGKWVQAKEIKDISGLTHGVGWCAPQQGACKLTLNVKEGVIEECLVETIGCSGMTHSAAMASEILPGKTILEALTTDLQLTEGYITKMYLDKDDQVIGYEFVHMGKFMDAIKKGVDANEALKSVTGHYGRTTAEQGAVKSIDPRKD